MKNFKREIFEQLGSLFYALATDQQIMPLQLGELKMRVKKDWLTEPQYTSSDKVSEASHLIGLTIDTLQAEGIDSHEAFQNFLDFYSKNPEIFSEALKDKIMETALAILDIFPSSGQEQNDYFLQLKSLFQDLKHNSEVDR
jgi:hypothetical protein